MSHIIFDPHPRELLSQLPCQPRAFFQYVRQRCRLFHHKDYQLQSPSCLKVCFSHEDKSTQGLSLGFKSLIHRAILYAKYSHGVILLKLSNKNILKRQNECFNLNYFLEIINQTSPSCVDSYKCFTLLTMSSYQRTLQNAELSSPFVKQGLILKMPFSHSLFHSYAF